MLVQEDHHLVLMPLDQRPDQALQRSNPDLQLQLIDHNSLHPAEALHLSSGRLNLAINSLFSFLSVHDISDPEVELATTIPSLATVINQILGMNMENATFNISI